MSPTFFRHPLLSSLIGQTQSLTSQKGHFLGSLKIQEEDDISCIVVGVCVLCNADVTINTGVTPDNGQMLGLAFVATCEECREEDTPAYTLAHNTLRLGLNYERF